MVDGCRQLHGVSCQSDNEGCCSQDHDRQNEVGGVSGSQVLMVVDDYVDTEGSHGVQGGIVLNEVGSYGLDDISSDHKRRSTQQLKTQREKEYYLALNRTCNQMCFKLHTQRDIILNGILLLQPEVVPLGTKFN